MTPQNSFFLFLVALCFTYTATAVAQTAGAGRGTSLAGLTLTNAVKMALSSVGNHEVRIAEESVNMARAKTDAARSVFLPQIMGSADYSRQLVNNAALGLTPQNGISLLPDTSTSDNYDARISLRANIAFDSIKRWKASDAGTDAAILELERVKDRIAVRTAELYLICVRNEQFVKAASNTLKMANSYLRWVTPRGRTVDILGAKADRAADNDNLLSAQNDLALSRLKLLKALGRGLDEINKLTLNAAKDISDPVIAAYLDNYLDEEAGEFTEEQVQKYNNAVNVHSKNTTNMKTTLETGERSRSDLKALEERKRQADTLHSSNMLEQWPALVLYGDYGPNGTNSKDLVNTYTLGGGLRLPLFAGGRMAAQKRRSVAEIERTRAQYYDLKAQVQLEIREAGETIDSASRRLAAANESLYFSWKEFNERNKSNVLNTNNLIERDQAKTKLSQAKFRGVDALFNYYRALINLWYAQGTIQEKLGVQ